MEESVPKRRYMKIRRGELPKRNNTTLKTRRKFKIKIISKLFTVCILNQYFHLMYQLIALTTPNGTVTLL